MYQKRLDEVRQELDDLKQAHHEQKEELCEAKEKNEHLQRANENLQRVCDALNAEQKQIEANIDDIQTKTIAALEKKLQTTTMPLPVPPFYVLVANFDRYQTYNSLFLSDPFYSHPGGYKMVVIVRPNGVGDKIRSHVSLHVHLLPGEFDDQLHWPFSGKVTVQAYNRTKEQWSFERAIEMTERKCGLETVSRCVDAPIAGAGAGCNDFLSLISLESYVKSANSLRIRIAGIEM